MNDQTTSGDSPFDASTLPVDRQTFAGGYRYHFLADQVTGSTTCILHGERSGRVVSKYGMIPGIGPPHCAVCVPDRLIEYRCTYISTIMSRLTRADLFISC